MSELTSGRTVLIVDDDLGFVWWLGEMLRDAGYRAVPALNTRQALSFVKELKLKIGVVVVNPALPGIRKFLKFLTETEAHGVRIILINDPAVSKPTRIEAHGILDRVSSWQTPSRPEWLRRLRRILMQAEQIARIPESGPHRPHKQD